jgi:UMF1 family MFS transporter
MSSQPPVSRLEIASWAMFDFANSSYTTLIVTVGFAVYFTSLVVPPDRGDLYWGAATFASNMLVVLSAPLLGAMADALARKKLFLFLSYLVCVGGTFALAAVTPGRVVLGIFLFVVSNVAFSLGENFVASFLPEISTPLNVGKISGFGWSLGYFGGLAAILVTRPFLAGGFQASNLSNLQLAWQVTALFFLVAALPTFLLLRERARPTPGVTVTTVAGEALRRLRETWRSLAHFRDLSSFLLSFFVFSAGLTTIIAFAGIFAVKTLAFTVGELMTLFLALQLSSAAGAFVFGWIQDRVGTKRTLSIVLWMWALVCGASAVVPDKVWFWPVALVAGLGIGSLQSASRALVGALSPVDKSAEFFGFWGLAGKAAYAVGPAIFGAVSSLAESQRLAILCNSLFFVAGWILLRKVNEERGLLAVAAWSQGHGR